MAYRWDSLFLCLNWFNWLGSFKELHINNLMDVVVTARCKRVGTFFSDCWWTTTSCAWLIWQVEVTLINKRCTKNKTFVCAGWINIWKCSMWRKTFFFAFQMQCAINKKNKKEFYLVFSGSIHWICGLNLHFILQVEQCFRGTYMAVSSLRLALRQFV